MFLAIFESVMFAKGLSAPQHSTYLVIFDDGLVLDGMPGVAVYGGIDWVGSDMRKRGWWEGDWKKIISPTPGDLRLSKFVIDIFLMSENMELVERRLSPKLIMLVTDSFRRSLCDLSGSDTFTWFPDELDWALAVTYDGDVGDWPSNGNDNDDLFITMLPLSSCCSSAIVAGWVWFVVTIRISFSSFPFGCGEVGGEPAWMVIGGGDGVAELIDCWAKLNDQFLKTST